MPTLKGKPRSANLRGFSWNSASSATRRQASAESSESWPESASGRFRLTQDSESSPNVTSGGSGHSVGRLEKVNRGGQQSGGAGGIRTLDTVLPYTHFPGERLRPLGHRSAFRWKGDPVEKRAPSGNLAACGGQP